MNLKPVAKALASFSIGAVALALLGSVFVVFVLQGYDAKFQDALFTALQVQLIGMAIFVIVAIVVLGVVLLFRARGGRASLIDIRLSGIAGMIFSIGVLLLGPLLQNVDPESLVNPVVGGAYVLIYPLVIGILLSRRGNGAGPKATAA